LRRRDIFVRGSGRWSDPRAKLLRGAAWETMRVAVCRSLNHELTPAAAITRLTQQLDSAYRQTAERWSDNSAVRIEQQNGHDRLIVTPLDKLEEPASLRLLREQVQALVPRVELPHLLQEVAAWTTMTGEFTHISEGQSRVGGHDLSICAILLAEACNIGLEPLTHQDHPALTRGRLSWIQQNFLRAETLTRANARLVDYHAGLPLVQAWGGGEVASADGLRFVVPVRTINAAPNEKYFARGRGVTYYNFISNQYSGFHGLVVPGAIKDSPYILEGLLEQQTSLRPVEVMADSGAYSDIVFGLFWLLGYQFSPRLADLGETRLWRIDPGADYGVLNDLARHRIQVDRIARNWDDLLRVAGSLKLNVVRASDLIRTLQLGSRPSSIARAIGELGRIAKSLHLLPFLDDESYRRRILTQLDRGESRHSLARALFHGQKGELRQKYREGQEDQLGALGLVLNMVVIWNTRYMALALDKLRAQGYAIRDEDVARLSPLIRKHINLLGRYDFDLPEAQQRGELRPLRNLNGSEDGPL
jgi:TnpA family transposase